MLANSMMMTMVMEKKEMMMTMVMVTVTLLKRASHSFNWKCNVVVTCPPGKSSSHRERSKVSTVEFLFEERKEQHCARQLSAGIFVREESSGTSPESWLSDEQADLTWCLCLTENPTFSCTPHAMAQHVEHTQESI